MLDEAEFSRHVAPLLYEEMRAQGFAAPKAADTDGGKVDNWQGGTPCNFNELLRKCQLDDVGQRHRRYRRRLGQKPDESNWSPSATGAIEAERRERASLDQGEKREDAERREKYKREEEETKKKEAAGQKLALLILAASILPWTATAGRRGGRRTRP